MKNCVLLVLLIFLIPCIMSGQTQEATTKDGKKVILNSDGTWQYAAEVTTLNGKKVILNADGTWKYADGVNSGTGNSGISFDLGGRGYQKLPPPKYDHQGEGRVVVEVYVDREGKVNRAITGVKGSTTLDEYLLRVAKDAAMEARFNPDPSASEVMKGTITYNFKLK